MKYGEELDLRKFHRSGTPNDWMACTRNMCMENANIDLPIYAVSKQKLIKTTSSLITKKPRTKLLRYVPKLDQLIFVQRSKFFRFPDTIWVQFLEVENGTSLIMYSRSNYGYYDFGVNKKRVKAWIGSIKAAL